MLPLFLSKCKFKTTPIKTPPAFNYFQSLRFICISTSTCSSSSDSSSSCSNGKKAIHKNDSLMIVSFLKKLSVKYSCYASKIARLETSDRPNLVLQFFQRCGLSEAQIEHIACRYPVILLANVEQTLKPKMDFFMSLGISQPDLNKIVTLDPLILSRSLKNQLIPSFELLKTITGSEGNALTAIKSHPVILRHRLPEYLTQNVTTLRNLNVPYSRVSELLTRYPEVITKLPQEFGKVVSTIWEMGFDPSSLSFIVAVSAKARNNDFHWNKKFENFRVFGFSDHEILRMFKKQPICMLYSEGRMKGVVDFYINKLHWSPLQLSLRPQVLQFSLEKRIIPRCSVLQVLMSRKKFDNSPMPTSILPLSDKDFLQKYVTKYEDEIPEVLDAFQGKLKCDEYNFVSGGLVKHIAL